MSGSLFAAQEAVYGVLTASAAVQALLGNPARLYDLVPPGAVFPYVSFGDVAVRSYDTKDRTGLEQVLLLQVWSRYRGRKEAKEIMQAIYGVLHNAALPVVGADLVTCTLQAASTLLENDGLTLKGTLRFRLVVQN